MMSNFSISVKHLVPARLYHDYSSLAPEIADIDAYNCRSAMEQAVSSVEKAMESSENCIKELIERDKSMMESLKASHQMQDELSEVLSDVLPLLLHLRYKYQSMPDNSAVVPSLKTVSEHIDRIRKVLGLRNLS